LWQLPLLAVGAWWLLRAARLGPLAQHRVWVAVLGLGVVLPLARVAPQTVEVRTVEGNAGLSLSAGDVRGDVSPVMEAPIRDGDGTSNVNWLQEVLRRRSVEVSAGVARGFAGVYFALMLLGGLRLVRTWGAARRLVADAEAVPVSECLRSLLEECGRRIGVGVPRVVESGEVQSPAIVGKVLVLPEAFVGYSEDEMRAALLHELAHLRRRDYGANVLCEMAGLPVVWHPASYAVRRRIRSTREMVCDGIAANAMGSAYAYALSLVDLAAKACVGDVEAQPMAVGLFTNNNLEERVMRLMETKHAMGMKASVVRLMSAAAGMMAVVALAAMVHVTPARAQAAASQASNATQEQTPAPPAIAGVPGPPALPAVSAVPAAPPLPELPALPAAPALPAMPALPPLPAQAAAPVPPSVPAPAPVPAPSPSAIVPDGIQIVPDKTQIVPDETQSADEAVAMAHGAKAKIEPEDGTYLHEWKGADGQPFKILNHEQAEPTAVQKKHYEEMYRREMADMDKELAQLKMNGPKLEQKMADAQREAAEARKLLQSPEFQKQMAELQSPEFKKQMADQMASLKIQLDASKQARFEALKQMKGLNSVEMQKSMADLRKQLDEGRLAGLNAQLQLKQLDSAEMKRQMADLDQQLKSLTGKEVQKQIEEQMKDARKQIEDAQKLMEKEREKLKVQPDSTCGGNCASAPQ